MAHRFVARSSLGSFRGPGAPGRGSSGDDPSGAVAFASGFAHGSSGAHGRGAPGDGPRGAGAFF